MADSISDPLWWKQYVAKLRKEFGPQVIDILFESGTLAIEALGPGAIFVDWDVFNEDALRWLDMYFSSSLISPVSGVASFPWAWMSNESTRVGVQREIENWIRSGADMTELERRLSFFFDTDRAHNIAVTEVTRIYASGNVMAWRASGIVQGKIWQTTNDERVCPICGALHETMVELDRGWEFTQEQLDANPDLARALRAPMSVIVPPAHVNCRCWLKPVVFDAYDPAELEKKLWQPVR